MPPTTPYTTALGGWEPAASIRDVIDRVGALTRTWDAAAYDGSYETGKWTARQILIHLAQTELALGTRARMALTTPNYTSQPFDQDGWLSRDAAMSGPEATAAFVALARMNLAMFENAPAADRAIAFAHPEYGALTVEWVYYQIAGHQRHHLAHLERIDRAHR